MKLKIINNFPAFSRNLIASYDIFHGTDDLNVPVSYFLMALHEAVSIGTSIVSIHIEKNPPITASILSQL